MRKRYLIIALIAVFALLILGGGAVFSLKLRVSSGFGSFWGSLSPCVDLRVRLAELEQENADLKAGFLLESIDPQNSIRVYSSYPFNNRSEIAIAAGSDEGVAEGSIVTYGTNILVGKVKTVAPKVSIVTTIFDPSFETAVRVGEEGIDALLRGGNELTLDLIAPTAVLTNGLAVYTASSEFPYGLSLGKVQGVERREDGMYKEVSVEPAFEVKALKDVLLRP